MPHKRLGPALVQVGDARPATDTHPSASPIYRNIISKDGFPKDWEGATTFYQLFNNTVAKYANEKAIGWRLKDEAGVAGPYEYMTYTELQNKANTIAYGFMHLGAKHKSKIGVYSTNCPEWMITIKAVDVFAGSIVPIYDSLGATAVEYIVNHSELEIAVVEDTKLESFAGAAEKVKDTVYTVVYLGPKHDGAVEKIEAQGIKVYSWAELEEFGRSYPAAGQVFPPTPEDIVTIMYTSGTTGTPKGVVLTHRNLMAAVIGGITMLNVQCKLNFGPGDSMLSYLTLAHSYGRQMEELTLAVGGTIGYWQKDVKKLMDDVAEFKPTYFLGVPRVLERIVDGVEAKIEKASPLVRAAFWSAFKAKLFMLRRGVPHWLAGMGVADVIFKKVQAAMGGRVRLIVSGGAPLAPHVEDFTTTCLAMTLQGYGLTETCAGTFIMLPDPRMAHTVGPPLATCEFKLESCPDLSYDALDKHAPKGEVLIRGPMVFSGYYKNEEKYKQEVDEDGFFHSGDIGTITRNGCLQIIDRKKNMFKLSQGEYVAAEHLESVYSQSHAIDQIWVYGNSQESSLVAVVVPQHWWLKRADFGNIGVEQAVNNDMVKQVMLEELTKVGKASHLKGFEMIKAVHLTPEPFSVEQGTMTQSLKLKRQQLQQMFQSEIDAMYSELKKKTSR